jgi:hypothetical protein
MKKELIIDIITYLLILLFSYAALSKLGDYDNFRLQLLQSPITTTYAGIISIVLPSGELLVVLVLILPATRLTGLYASLFLLSLFTTYIYVLLHYSFYISCNCGGILGHLKLSTHFWFNMVFLVITIAGILLEGTNRITQKLILTRQKQEYGIA